MRKSVPKKVGPKKKNVKVNVKKKSVVTTPPPQERITAKDILYLVADTIEDNFIYKDAARANAENLSFDITRMLLYEEGGTRVTNHKYKMKECADCG